MTTTPRRILFVAAEAQPFIKTGGLADVAGTLPAALHDLGHDVRVLIPGYEAGVARAMAIGPVETIAALPTAPGGRLLQARLAGGCPVWFYATDAFQARGDRPYERRTGSPWPDNAARFDEFARVAVALADDAFDLGWRADVIHAHDWHAGLVPVHAMLARVPAATVFTVHNLAFQGRFPGTTMAELGLPSWLFHWQALEFNGELSFMKGGLGFADRISTVSRTYAAEILEPRFGEGLDGLLRHRRKALTGIVNGIDTTTWDPSTDPCLARRYSAARPAGKRDCRRALLAETGLSADTETPLIAYVGRLSEQKGVDLLLRALPEILALPAAVVVLGAGDAPLERGLTAAAATHRGRLHFHHGFDEAFAHRLYAGADMLLMPSRFEPCGLSQLNAMRYGCVPIAHRTGGLAETVVDATTDRLADGSATGFQFAPHGRPELLAAFRRALDLFRRPRKWRRILAAGMSRDWSWTRSAGEYETLYAAASMARRGLLAARWAGEPGSSPQNTRRAGSNDGGRG